MPELPEVETVRRGLQPVMEGARIARVDQRRADLRFPFPLRFAGRIEGQTVISVSRRAKYLLFHLENGLTLLSHLGMSGSFRIEKGGGGEEMPGLFHLPRGKLLAHDHAVFSLSSPGREECRVIYNDPRRFGFMDLIEPGGLSENRFLQGLGAEPVGNELSGALISKLFAKKAAPLKSALLDQRLIAGLGNIYVCEALWRSGLSPERASMTISGTIQADRLASDIREVIAEAIQAGGSSLRDYVQTDGSLGYFQHSFSVYDREGEPCRKARCKGTVSRIVQSGRSSFYCPACQK
jgi:formamidopyrimidine-DNA glycosylase